MRPRAITAAAIAPVPMPSADNAVNAVSPSMPPPVLLRATTGTSEMAPAPLIQNQETATLLVQRTGSCAISQRNAHVDAKTLTFARRPGAAQLVGGIKRLAAKQAMAIATSCMTVSS